VYPDLNLRDWPFRTAPDREFGAIWAGRHETENQLGRILRRMSLAPRSSLYVMWANFGMGKTHALYHLAHLCDTDTPNLLPVYAVLPRQAKGFIDVYRAVAAALPMDRLAESLKELGSQWPRQLSLHPLFADFPDIANALVACLGSDDTRLSIARQWLTAQVGIPRSALNQIGVSRLIRNAEDAVSALTVLTRLLTVGDRRRKLLLMIDEFQRVGQLRARIMTETNVSLHTYFNANSTGLGLILSMSFGRQADVKFMLSEELRSRADPEMLTFDVFSPDQALEFVSDLLSQFRLSESDNPFFPFTKGACMVIIDHIGTRAVLTPRRLMHYFSLVLENWQVDGGPDGELRIQHASKYLEDPNLSMLDIDGDATVGVGDE